MNLRPKTPTQYCNFLMWIAVVILLVLIYKGLPIWIEIYNDLVSIIGIKVIATILATILMCLVLLKHFKNKKK